MAKDHDKDQEKPATKDESTKDDPKESKEEENPMGVWGTPMGGSSHDY